MAPRAVCRRVPTPMPGGLRAIPRSRGASARILDFRRGWCKRARVGDPGRRSAAKAEASREGGKARLQQNLDGPGGHASGYVGAYPDVNGREAARTVIGQPPLAQMHAENWRER